MPKMPHGSALIVGIANYPRVNPLPETVLQDARDVAALLASPYHCGYPDERIRVLLDEDAALEGLRAGLSWLADTAGADGTALLFFSGHGGRIEEGRAAGTYLIPYDCDARDLAHTALSGAELTDLLRAIRAPRLLALFDCCYAGGTGEPKGLSPQAPRFKAGLDEATYERLAQGSGRVIMASSRADEVSLVLEGMPNSLFTHCLLEALRGAARTRGDGLIRVLDVFDYVSEAVPARGPQHPIFKASDLENNFPIALYLGGKAEAAAPARRPRSAVDRRALREALVAAFDIEELEVLCADVRQDLADEGIDLRLDLELVGGTGKRAKVLNLVGYLERRGYLAYLVAAVRRARPGIV